MRAHGLRPETPRQNTACPTGLYHNATHRSDFGPYYKETTHFMQRPLRKAVVLLIGIGVFLYVISPHAGQLLHVSQASLGNPSSSQVSHTVERIGQLDPGQYDSHAEYNLWAYSACSAAAMTEVVNAYDGNFRIHDILVVEERVGAITPQSGLLYDGGIERTMTQPPFNMQTTWGYERSLSQVIDTANRGVPVIVSWPPSRYKGGHLVVVTGGNGTTVFLADSSIWDRHAVSRVQFLKWWGGFSAIVKPTA